MFGHGNGNRQGDAAATASPSSGEARTPEPAPASEMQGSQPASAEASPSTQRKRGGLRGIFKHKDKSAPMGSPLAPQDGPAPPPGRDIARDAAGTPPAVAAQRPSKEDVALPEYGGLASDSQVGGAATLLRLLCGTAPHVSPCGKLLLTPCRAVPCRAPHRGPPMRRRRQPRNRRRASCAIYLGARRTRTVRVTRALL